MKNLNVNDLAKIHGGTNNNLVHYAYDPIFPFPVVGIVHKPIDTIIPLPKVPVDLT